MPILIDLSQIAISNVMMSPARREGLPVDGHLIKHMIINSLRKWSNNYKNKYGSIVVCCDSKNYWRREIFPHYKASRKKHKEDSGLDWDAIFEAIDEMKQDIRDHFPYKVIEVDGTEGDDCIATIVKHNLHEDFIIIGSDKDYGQLHRFGNVKQFSTKAKKLVNIPDPVAQLRELIIRGDEGDGIPNIKSDSDTFVNSAKRQKCMYDAEVARWVKLKPELFCENKKMLENHQRNKELIDFDHIPEKYTEAILAEYQKSPCGTKKTLLNYLIKNRMGLLIKDIGQF